MNEDESTEGSGCEKKRSEGLNVLLKKKKNEDTSPKK